MFWRELDCELELYDYGLMGLAVIGGVISAHLNECDEYSFALRFVGYLIGYLFAGALFSLSLKAVRVIFF
jgi:hypothetical protein